MLPDFALRIAVDSSGNAYVTGATVSPNFPVSTGALRNTLHVSICGRGSGGVAGQRQFPCPDAFVTKTEFIRDGPSLFHIPGGHTLRHWYCIAVDSSGNAYVAGETESTDFPTTSTGFRTERSPNWPSVPDELNPAGSQILYSTYLGGTAGSRGREVMC